MMKDYFNVLKPVLISAFGIVQNLGIAKPILNFSISALTIIYLLIRIKNEKSSKN